MAAYVIVQAEVTDWEKFRKYLKETPATIAKYSGRYVARGGEMEILEGRTLGDRIVLIEFPSLEKARAWYNSDDYRQVRLLREGAAVGHIMAIEGC